MTRFLCCYGTRPEKIKLEPVITALRKRGASVETWFSGQSPDLVDEEAYSCFQYAEDDGLQAGIAEVLAHIQSIFVTEGKPDAIIIQGDTTTAFAVALAAYLADVPVAHVEAGLRTYRRDPYPEEAFRGMIAWLATWHFCPDMDAAANITRETRRFDTEIEDEKVEGVYVTGNTIIDTLPIAPFRVLVTLHRRENWGERISNALIEMSLIPKISVTAIRHPNWANFNYTQGGCLRFIDPITHDDLLDLMLNSAIVVTDSGGLQEEAAHFGIPCIVVREKTERVALLSTGAVQLVNPDEPEELREALESELAKRTQYGDGHAGEKIAEILMESLA